MKIKEVRLIHSIKVGTSLAGSTYSGALGDTFVVDGPFLFITRGGIERGVHWSAVSDFSRETEAEAKPVTQVRAKKLEPVA